MQALHGVLQRHGYATSKAATARLLGIREPNIWAYLVEAGSTSHIRPRPETLHRWCSRLVGLTGLQVTIVLPPASALCVHVQGRAQDRVPIVPYLLETDHHPRSNNQQRS